MTIFIYFDEDKHTSYKKKANYKEGLWKDRFHIHTYIAGGFILFNQLIIH